MSTYWGLKCRDCNEQTDMFINHGDDYIISAIKVYPYYLACKEVVFYSSLPSWPFADVASFLEDHYQHKFVLLNEYGEEKEIDGIQGSGVAERE